MSTVTVLAASMTSALLAAIWQGLLLATVVALCLRRVPALSAAARSLVWLTVAALAVLLHFTQSPAIQSSAHAGLAASTLHPALPLDARWSLVIAALWLPASLIRAVQLVTGALELRRLARTATPVAAPESCDLLLARSQRPESHAAQLCTSTEVDRPSVLGFFRPRILVPATLLDTLTPAELHQVLLHELEHLRRRDDWTNLFGRLALVLFPLNPVLLWLECRLATERELACDDRVLQATGARKAYATCLAHLAEHTLVRRGVSLALALVGIQSAWPRRSELARRVARILSLPIHPLNPRRSTAFVTLLIALVTGGSIELAHSPQLIRFTSPVSQSDFTASTNTRTGDELVPVVYHPRTSASPFVATEAILNTRQASVHFTAATMKAVSRPTSKLPVRPVLHRIPSPLNSSIRLTGFEAQPDAPVRLTLTVATPSYFSYAAVPVQGGWILVLLPVQTAQPTFTLAL